jgi:hypothetical protein
MHFSFLNNFFLYIHVAVHRNRFLFNNQIIQIYSVIKLYMFPATSAPIIRSFLLYVRTGEFHAGFDDPLPSKVLGSSHQTCMKLTSAKRTVENS